MSHRFLKDVNIALNREFEDYLDDLAFEKHFGLPSFVITMAFNPLWPESKNYFADGKVELDYVPHITFKRRLDSLMDYLKSENSLFQAITAVSWTISFDGKGMPYAYILIYLNRRSLFTSGDIDNMISAEIPDAHVDPELYDIIEKFMIQGSSDNVIPSYAQNIEDVWPKHFATDTYMDNEGILIYRRRYDGRVLVKDGVTYDNRSVIPYNRILTLKYQTYISLELHPRVHTRTAFIKAHSETLRDMHMFVNIWENLKFPITYRTSEVIRLPLHLPFQQSSGDDAARSRSKLIAWMECNRKNESARKLTYIDFPLNFIWNVDTHEWLPRVDGVAVGRLQHIQRHTGEIYYLRLLLCVVKGAMCFEDIRTVDGKVHETFRIACCKRGLIEM